MIDSQFQHQLLQEISVLPVEKQHQVLDYVRSISTPRPLGTPGAELMKFVVAITADDCDRMMRAIQEDCERIDVDGW